MNYTVEKIGAVIRGKFLQFNRDCSIEHLLPDSRKAYFPSSSLFFALKGPRRNGHQFIGELYKKGVENFVVSELIDVGEYPSANFILVNDVLSALQELAAYHRGQFNRLPDGTIFPVIGITGSNGKTIVKEWLYQLLHEDYNIIRSPKSYNSQIGVPLSVWQINEQHTLAIFEAGISQPGEMERLEAIIRPGIGILTNIGEAHNAGFTDQRNKLAEKLKLFKASGILIANGDDALIREMTKASGINCFWWGNGDGNHLQITSVRKEAFQTIIAATYADGPGHDVQAEHALNQINITIPFTDNAAVENAISCLCILLHLGVDHNTINERMRTLMPVNMRLELKKGINHCAIINDSYSADLSSLNIALNFLQQQSAGGKKTVILSDFLQTGQTHKELYAQIALLLYNYRVDRVIGIGSGISKYLDFSTLKGERKIEEQFYSSVDEFRFYFRSSQFREETILVKGARVFEFEHLVHLLEQKVHQTVLEINLNAVIHNLKQYQQLLNPVTRIMAMVKAFAYGSGGAEIANILQYHKVDYLGVAYADEGVELRKAGITLPVMVMNPEESTFEAIIEYNLEPEIYSFTLLEKLDIFLQQEGLQQYPVHIEIETGMNRLGFAWADITRLGSYLHASPSFKVQSVFSHLVASEEKLQDGFTLHQFSRFTEAADNLQNMLGYSFIKHLSNSAAILLHPELQLDMVRLGIGLYGVDSAGTHQLDLQTVATLKSTVAQVRFVPAGESVSYNRKGIVKNDSLIATIRVGYADGYPRRLSNGAGKMVIKGQLAPVIGIVCMDMTMVDITGIPGVQEGDEVIIFGNVLPVQQVAAWAQTIPYEIMTGISQRVKRVYFEE